MSDHGPKTMSSEHLADLMAGLRDGQIRIQARDGVAHVGLKCSHVENGACVECLMPMLDAFYRMAEHLAVTKKSLRTVQAIARQHSSAYVREIKHIAGKALDWTPPTPGPERTTT